MMEEEKNNVENSAEPIGVRKKKPLQRKRLKLPHRKHGKKPRQKRRRHARRRNRSLRSCSAARRKKNTGRVSARNADRK